MWTTNMIVYSSTKSQFHKDILANNIESKIQDLMYAKTNKRVSQSELRSWQNSLRHMNDVINDSSIPNSCKVALEYNIPLTSKRIDFILTGRDQQKNDSVIIVELKQWETAEVTTKDAIVSTFLGGTTRETEHPSYQAWTYASLIRDFNQTVQDENIHLHPCAYLHNCTSDSTIKDSRYQDHITKAPVFLKSDTLKLRDFIKKNIQYGDDKELLYRIEGGKIRPSKKLADELSSMLAGNQEFMMIDEQKLVYETALHLSKHVEDSNSRKQVMIIEGGPGTGKTVVAINLLVAITQQERLAQYITKNSAPREVYHSKLTGSFKKSHINNLFKGSGVYIDTEPNFYNTLLVDEAHRLNAKSGMFSHLGENQVKEIICASRLSIFFVDDDQMVTIKDIGEKSEIQKWAHTLNAQVHNFSLSSQFRCNGSTAYLAWLENTLQIRETANFELDKSELDFQVFDNPNDMRNAIEEKNLLNNSARIVAGYCWKWISKKDPEAFDIEIPEHDFKMQWNLTKDGMLWILKPESVKEAGCIHTCQGLEVDYVGVIIGDDFIIRNGKVITNLNNRASSDKSVSGHKKLFKADPEAHANLSDKIIKNTYKTLMTRGQKGCYIYCTDKETREFFKAQLQISEYDRDELKVASQTIFHHSEVSPFVNAVPFYDIQVTAGEFSESTLPDELSWFKLPEPYHSSSDYFVVKVTGDSMNKKIPNGSFCLFKRDPGGSRENKIVLVENFGIHDQEFGAGYTVKKYSSQKVLSDDSWNHSEIRLQPMSYFSHYEDIVLSEGEVDNFKILGVFVGVVEVG